MTIPEIDLVLTHGTLGGRFTTVEGILEQIYEELAEKAFVGDSSEGTEREKFKKFLSGLKAVRSLTNYQLMYMCQPITWDNL